VCQDRVRKILGEIKLNYWNEIKLNVVEFSVRDGGEWRF
jgi:hypothetical protein